MTEYKNEAVFMRVSKSGDSVYIQNIDERLGADVSALIANKGEMENLLKGNAEWVQLGIVKREEAL
jgi:hypothetical protein